MITLSVAFEALRTINFSTRLFDLGQGFASLNLSYSKDIKHRSVAFTLHALVFDMIDKTCVRDIYSENPLKLDNTDTLACPFGICINRVLLHIVSKFRNK